LLVALITLSAPVLAKKKNRPMDLDCAVQTVVQRTGGKVLAADVVESKKSYFFRIKILTPRGHVRYVRVNPQAECVF